MVIEGANSVRVDNLGKAIGMPVGPLTVHDEVSLELTRKAGETWADMGVEDKWGNGDAMREMVQFLVTENGRGGRHHGGGYYDYSDGKAIWSGLVEKYYNENYQISEDDIKDRLLFSCLLYTSPSPRDATLSRMPSSA